MPRPDDHLGDATRGRQVDQVGRRLQRSQMGVEEGGANFLRRIIRPEGPADIGAPGGVRAAAANILGNPDP
jgi:hypothetical protein